MLTVMAMAINPKREKIRHMRQVFLWEATPPFSDPSDDFRPFIEPFPIDADSPRGAVIVCPGGGYEHRSSSYEGRDVCRVFNKAGLHSVLLEYRVRPHRYPAGLLDLARAVAIVRENSEKWNIDPNKIAVLGFSAGGHLAASLGIYYDEASAIVKKQIPSHSSSRPDALILCYPVLTSGKYANQGSFKNLLGVDISEELLKKMSLELNVHKDVPPVFLWHTADDQVVPVENSLHFAEELSKLKIPFEMHIYPKGRHGLGLATNDRHMGTWSSLCCEWLQSQGYIQ